MVINLVVENSRKLNQVRWAPLPVRRAVLAALGPTPRWRAASARPARAGAWRRHAPAAARQRASLSRRAPRAAGDVARAAPDAVVWRDWRSPAADTNADTCAARHSPHRPRSTQDGRDWTKTALPKM